MGKAYPFVEAVQKNPGHDQAAHQWNLDCPLLSIKPIDAHFCRMPPDYRSELDRREFCRNGRHWEAALQWQRGLLGTAHAELVASMAKPSRRLQYKRRVPQGLQLRAVEHEALPERTRM